MSKAPPQGHSSWLLHMFLVWPFGTAMLSISIGRLCEMKQSFNTWGDPENCRLQKLQVVFMDCTQTSKDRHVRISKRPRKVDTNFFMNKGSTDDECCIPRLCSQQLGLGVLYSRHHWRLSEKKEQALLEDSLLGTCLTWTAILPLLLVAGTFCRLWETSF